MIKCLQVKKPVSCIDFLHEEGMCLSKMSVITSYVSQRYSLLDSTMLGELPHVVFVLVSCPG